MKQIIIIIIIIIIISGTVVTVNAYVRIVIRIMVELL
jgi:hypothetical protein